MTKHLGPVMIGSLVTIVLSIFITPFLSIIIGGLIAGIMCKGGASGGAKVGFLLGIILAIPSFFIMVCVLALIIPFVGTIVGAIIGELGVVLMVIIGVLLMVISGVLGLIGGVIGGSIGGENRYNIENRFEAEKPFIIEPFIVLVAVLAPILFFLGVAYSHFIMLPILLSFLNALAMSGGATSTWSLESWTIFATMMTVVFGLTFELPIVLPLLVRFGVVSYQNLREHRKHGIVIVFIVAAIITPPDVLSQMMIALPMLLFYEVGLLTARSAIK
ncbi:MAG: twin-arginine translocase subunit TatC [Methanocellales archaeon]|nr:twin-arginine translocase subunit TatC [Methanocellales archaeon]